MVGVAGRGTVEHGSCTASQVRPVTYAVSGVKVQSSWTRLMCGYAVGTLEVGAAVTGVSVVVGGTGGYSWAREDGCILHHSLVSILCTIHQVLYIVQCGSPLAPTP